MTRRMRLPRYSPAGAKIAPGGSLLAAVSLATVVNIAAQLSRNVSPPTIKTDSLDELTATRAVSVQLEANGDGVTWTLDAGDLPDGLSLSSAGVLSGTPTGEETAVFTVRATNAAGSDTQELTLEVNAAPAITTTTLEDATQGQAYAVTLAATGGTGDGTWSVTAGSLPAGLSLDAGTGELSGTPPAVETKTFTVTYTDENGATDEQELELDVVASFADPDTFTSLRANFGFAAEDITFEVSPATQVASVAGNLGTGEHTPDAGDISFNANGTGVTWAADPMGNGRPGCAFDAASSLRTGNTSPAAVLAADVSWLAIVCWIDTGGISTDEASVLYTNDAVLSDALAYFGIHLRSGGQVYAYNYDGNVDGAPGAFEYDVPHLFVWRHTGGKIGLSVDGGAFVEVDSGNTQALNSTFIELMESAAGGVQRLMMHDSVPSNEAEIIASLVGEYAIGEA